MSRLSALRTGSPRTVADLYVRGRSNSLNLIRLFLASAVVVFHTYAAAGITYPGGGIQTLIGNFPVNGFFTISGFLIYQSWARRPHVTSFLLARVVRIYPAFWACLVIVALVFAPISVAIQGRDAFAQAFSWESLTYVVKNVSLAMLQWDIAGTPANVPYPDVWNASLWTLAWEFLCYLALMVLGLFGMTSRRWILPTAFGFAVLLNVVSMFPAMYVEAVARTGRFSIFFLAGALAAQHAHRIPGSWSVAVTMLAVTGASAWIPNGWNIVQAPTAAIGLIILGGLFQPSWAQLRNDISYGVYIFAFPVQQLLAVAGLGYLGVFGFSLLALAITVPFAVASWFLVERPALALRKRSPVRTRGRATSASPEGASAAP
ncbi:acyltransferase family protein [Microbacterium sp.]|uniref:acyltransferase family protein n=1 Tax=Microbacterium sp. TaxID=51671 RepID=UPI003C771A3F